MLAAGEKEDPAVGGQLEIGRDVEVPGPLAFLAEVPEKPAVGREDLEVTSPQSRTIDVAAGIDVKILRDG